MPTIDAVTMKEFLKPQNAIATDDCRPAMTPDGELWEYPCGLSCTTEVLSQIPGAHYAAIKFVHERHHRECGVVESWCVLESVDTKGSSVKVTFDCKCGGKHS